jgi:cytochrome c-type biogenesis protein CcmE
MKLNRRKRLYLIAVILFGVTAAVSLAVYALGQNMNLYFTPAQIVAGEAPSGRVLRMGGMVKKGSFKRVSNSLQVHFVLTDFRSVGKDKGVSVTVKANEVAVEYSGILPALFREGQGVVVQGKLSGNQLFVADQVLAKHDEKYMPPGMEN